MDHVLRLDPNVDYLKQRRVSAETLDHYGVGYCSRGRLRGYVAMPIYLPDQPVGECPVVYLGRWCGEDFHEKGKPKYLWGAAVPKGKILVGLREALDGIGDRPVVCVEGIFDLFRVVDCGYRHVVAVIGADLSDDQAQLLIGLGRAAVIMFDGDESGQAGARKAAAKLIRDLSVRVVSMPDGRDPADLSVDELREHLGFLFS
jgi:DNA primase